MTRPLTPPLLTLLLTLALLLSGLRGPSLASAWQSVWLASAALQTAAALLWTARALAARRWPSPPEVVALLLWASTVADGAGPWYVLPALVEHYREAGLGPEEAARVAAGRAWELARWQAVAVWGCVAGWQGWWWARRAGRKG